MENKVDELKGRVKEAMGALSDDDSLKDEGKIDKAAGSVKQKIDKAADVLKDAVNPDSEADKPRPDPPRE